MASAAVQVARETSFDLRQAELDTSEIGATIRAAYKTPFHREVPDVVALAKERKDNFDSELPAWPTSPDLKPRALVRPLVTASVVGSLAVLATIFFQSTPGGFAEGQLLSETYSMTYAGGYVALLALLLFFFGAFLHSRRTKNAEAMVRKLEVVPVEAVKRLVHSISVDKCVGCNLCVQACPASVLAIVNHKATVVNFDACIQCKLCEQACVFDAFHMHAADKEPPSSKLPDVDSWYETTTKGMYLIGQAAGTPQIKNASNIGTAVVCHAVGRGLKPGTGQELGAAYDVIIVGSGPAGLSAALTCARLGLSYVVLEKQRDFAWTIRNYYHKGKPIKAEPNNVEMLGMLPHWEMTREELLANWEQCIVDANLQIAYEQDVTAVNRVGEILIVTVSDAKGNARVQYSAARIILAVGTLGSPRKLSCPGDHLHKVRNFLVDPQEVRGRNVLVVGGSDLAIEVALTLKESNKVWISCRNARFERVKPKNLELIMAAIEAGQVIPLWSTVVSGVDETAVTLSNRVNNEPMTLPNDLIFAMIGNHPPSKFLESLGVRNIDRPYGWAPQRSDVLVRSSHLQL